MADKEKKLSPKQREFCREYIKKRNGTEAAIKAGYAKDSATVTGSQLLTKPNVILEIKRLEELRDKNALMSVAEADQRLSTLARVNFKDFFTADGEARPISELTDEQAYCLKEVTRIETSLGASQKIKTTDPLQALRTIYERRGLLKNQVEGNLKITFVPSFGESTGSAVPELPAPDDDFGSG